MWKVLIADDEPKIRRGLRKSVELLRPDMVVVAEAEDGEMALGLVESQKPDILMIDIRMPFLNGLDLIEKIKEVHADCIIIVVTGHDEFEYAKRALQLKVFEYVLKPVSQDLLASVLERAEAELSGTRKQNKYIVWAREQLERNMPLLREQFFRDWVKGRLSGYELEEQAGFLGIKIGDYRSMVIIHLIEHFVNVDQAREKERRLALLAVFKIVEEELKAFPPLSVFQDEHNNIVAVSGAAEGPDWLEALSRIESSTGRSLSEALILVHNSIPGEPDGIPEIYERLSGDIDCKNTYRTCVVLAQKHIDTHFTEPDLSLEKTASAVGISPGYLSRLLKQATGLSFIDYLIRVRVTRAVELMNDPAVKIYEVAEAVGYQSQHYFSRAFKRVFGRSPIEFRKKGA